MAERKKLSIEMSAKDAVDAWFADYTPGEDADGNIRYTSAAVPPRLVRAYAADRPDMTPVDEFRAALARLGAPGRRTLARLAGVLAELEAENPGMLIFVKLG